MINKNRNIGGQAMIEFEKNYTPGPWEKMDEWSVHKKYDSRICEIIPWKIEGDDDLAKLKILEDIANTNLIVNAPKMAEYMMDRANCIEKEICLGVCYDPDGSKEELQTILSILKDAGIEIVKDGD